MIEHYRALILHNYIPDEEVDSVESDKTYVGDDNVYKDDDFVDGL